MFRQDEKGEKMRKEKKKLHFFSLCGKLKLNSQQDSWNSSNNWVMRYENTVGLSYPKVWSPRSHLVSREMLTHSNVFYMHYMHTDLLIWRNVKKTPTTTQRQGSLLHYPCRSSHNRNISAPLHLCPGSCQFCFQENSNKERLSASDTFSCWHLNYFPGSISVAATNALSPWLQFSGLRFGKKKKG